MWINLYHGTTSIVAKAIFNSNINVAKGGGEFGRGFYMGASKRLARRRAFHKSYNEKGTANAAMRLRGNILKLELSIPNFRFAYHLRSLDLASAIGLYASLKKHKTLATFIDDFDAISGPIVGWSRYHQVVQFKFQSERIEGALNTGCKAGALRGKAVI